jgi:hypothetical protein
MITKSMPVSLDSNDRKRQIAANARLLVDLNLTSSHRPSIPKKKYNASCILGMAYTTCESIGCTKNTSDNMSAKNGLNEYLKNMKSRMVLPMHNSSWNK